MSEIAAGVEKQLQTDVPKQDALAVDAHEQQGLKVTKATGPEWQQVADVARQDRCAARWCRLTSSISPSRNATRSASARRAAHRPSEPTRRARRGRGRRHRADGDGGAPASRNRPPPRCSASAFPAPVRSFSISCCGSAFSAPRSPRARQAARARERHVHSRGPLAPRGRHLLRRGRRRACRRFSPGARVELVADRARGGHDRSAPAFRPGWRSSVLPIGFALIAARLVWRASPRWSGAALRGVGIVAALAADAFARSGSRRSRRGPGLR